MLMKILAEDHYIICDDSEIKEGDWVVGCTRTVVQCMYPENVHHRDVKKITHSTQPLDKSLFFTDRVWGCERLSLGEVKELLGVVDVEKKANKQWGNVHRTGVLGYIEGYNQALEDNKEQKYTEEDLRKMFEMGIGLSSFSDTDENKFKYALNHIQPKTEWEVEFVDGKLKLKQ